MLRTSQIVLVGLALAAGPIATATACHRCGKPCVTYQTVEKTIMVPKTTYEKRIIDCVAYKPVTYNVTVEELVRKPVVSEVTRLCTIMVPKKQIRTECFTVCKPVWTKETREYCTMVSEPVVRKGVRTVCKPVITKEKRIICEDQGQWVVDKNGCKCWEPNIVEKEIEVEVCSTELVKEPFEYTDYICKPVKKTCEVNVCHYEYEQMTRDIEYTICVPKQVEKTFKVTTYECHTVERVRKCTKMEPYPVKKEISVPVCTMVPKTIFCQVPVYCCCP